MFEHADVLVLFCLVSKSDSLLRELLTLLSDDERHQAARFVFEKDRTLYVTAHALLRQSLRLATRQTDIHFRTNKFGKPEIAAFGNWPTVKFNISHSGPVAVCSLSQRFEVGVDVEEVDEARSFEEIVASQFTPFEQDRLAAYPATARMDAFFRFWTLKEALVKALGVGLQGMNRYSVDPDRPSLAAAGSPDEALAVHLEQRLLTSSCWASLAVLRPPGNSVTVEWRCVPADQIARGFGE
jgi:4'-phosphopantetheinyl transferase